MVRVSVQAPLERREGVEVAVVLQLLELVPQNILEEVVLRHPMVAVVEVALQDQMVMVATVVHAPHSVKRVVVVVEMVVGLPEHLLLDSGRLAATEETTSAVVEVAPVEREDLMVTE